MIWILLIISFIGLIIGTYTDFKTREVPDFVNYSLIFIGLGVHLIYSIVTKNWMFFLYGVSGFLIALAIAFAMFYGGQWGGGDSKMIMALGSLIGLDFKIDSFFVSLLVNMFIIGAVYGLIYGAVLAFKHRKEFLAWFRKIAEKRRNAQIRKSVLVVSLMLFVASFFFDKFFQLVLIFLIFILWISIYLFIFTKAVEKCCMYKFVRPERLTEGDWIARNIFIDGKYICGPRDLGISKQQIATLIKLKRRGKIKDVLVKEGIPFVPSFLIAFIFTYFYGSILFFLVNIT